MPDEETLDAMTALVTGMDGKPFSDITNPDKRMQIIELAIAAEHNQAMHDARNHLEDIAHWFKKSDNYYEVR